MVHQSGAAEDAAFSPDCLIFDVDGVLIEAGRSFPEMIRMTVESEWERSGLLADAPGYSERHNEVLKRHGSFNDDYDIVWALLNISAAKGEKKLSKALPSPEELKKIIETCGGDCVKWLTGAFPEKFKRQSVRKHSAAAYFGQDGQNGTYSLETPLLLCHWSSLPLPAYIYTGRNDDEWRLAKEILSWNDFPDERAVTYDSGMLKPSPDGISHICEKFGHDRPVFFGDTASDKIAMDAFGKGWFVAIGEILRDEKPNYSCVEDALEHLIGWRRGMDGENKKRQL
jgi:phosphoglycolate phosphatase-like HAD superfamily hydrolase